MKLTIIEGGLALAPVFSQPDSFLPGKEAVAAETTRRIKAIGYDQALARQFVSGQPMPHRIKSLQLQIAFAGRKIATLNPIPTDFRDNRYWPAASE